MMEEDYGHFCEIEDHSTFTKYYTSRNMSIPRIYFQQPPNNDETIKTKRYNNRKIIIYTQNSELFTKKHRFHNNTDSNIGIGIDIDIGVDGHNNPHDTGNSRAKVFIIGIVCSLAVVITIEYWLFGYY